MSVKILIDMNLSPDWIPLLKQHGWTAVHWSTFGDSTAPDSLVMEWASRNAHVVFTHDLDFGTALALTHARGPSVLQIRGQEVLPDSAGQAVVAAFRQYEAELASGALVVVDSKKLRVRILPL